MSINVVFMVIVTVVLTITAADMMRKVLDKVKNAAGVMIYAMFLTTAVLFMMMIAIVMVIVVATMAMFKINVMRDVGEWSSLKSLNHDLPD